MIGFFNLTDRLRLYSSNSKDLEFEVLMSEGGDARQYLDMEQIMREGMYDMVVEFLDMQDDYGSEVGVVLSTDFNEWKAEEVVVGEEKSVNIREIDNLNPDLPNITLHTHPFSGDVSSSVVRSIPDTIKDMYALTINQSMPDTMYVDLVVTRDSEGVVYINANIFPEVPNLEVSEEAQNYWDMLIEGKSLLGEGSGQELKDSLTSTLYEMGVRKEVLKITEV